MKFGGSASLRAYDELGNVRSLKGKMDKGKRPSREEYWDEYNKFREQLEALSEKSRILRNHFYNNAFNNGTLLKVAEVRGIVDELYRIAERYNE